MNGRALVRGAPMFALLLILVGCAGNEVELIPGDGFGGDGGASEAPALPGLVSLRIAPSDQEVTDDGISPPEQVRYKAYGTFASGEREVTRQVGWSLNDARLGAVNAGRVSTAGVAGKTQVRAAAGDVEAEGALTVRLRLVIVTDDTASGAPGLFPDDATGDLTGDALSPALSYPSANTMFPRNLEHVLHQWRAGAQLDLFEARFESDLALIRFFTAQHALLPDLAGWRALAESHAGGSVRFSVRAITQNDPSKVYSSKPVTLHYSESAVLGALYYWSTSAQGILRANISSPSASKFFPAPESGDVTCAACHTVSRNGRRLALGYGGETLRQVSIPDRKLEISSTVTDPMMPDPMMPGPTMPDPMMPDPTMPGTGIGYGWGTFNPDATRLLVANNGALTLFDADTGAELRKLKLPKDVVATHPDWSPDGKWVVVALGKGKQGNKDVKETSLARIAVQAGDAFGQPEVLLQSAGKEDTLFFPMYSPDSKWLAFVRAQGKSKDNPSSQIYLLAADGTGAPIALDHLNHFVRQDSAVLNNGNAMPTWAPSTTAGVFWLAFSSMRDYGDVLVGTRRDQLWGAAIDPALIAAGKDPSYSAFWLPFQQLEECNHRAFWALDPDQACPAASEICDNVDNDCDGVVDEECCTPQVEVCANAIDDDCDGTIDDGCGCSLSEDCDNALDDDCDGLTDADDEDCVIVE